jgi:hypothetical protein
MKRALTVTSFVVMGLVCQAQTKPTSTPRTPAPKREFSTVAPLSYESSLAYGKMTLLKTLSRQPSGTEYTTTYSLVGSESHSGFNNGKPLEIKLSKDYYYGTFLNSYREIAAKTAVLNSFVTEKKLALNNEKDWAYLINYYNGL